VTVPDGPGPADARDRAMLEVLYGTGARASEVVGLDLGAVDLEEARAVLTGKGNRQRMVPLGGPAVEAIAAWLPARLDLGPRDDAVFLNLRGGRLTRQTVFDIVKRAAERAGLDPSEVSPHVLRHSAATHMIEAGADIRSVQEMLGHANVNTTQVYTRVTPRHLREIYLEAHPRSQ
ncbi:MAG: tyrosine-type recombinase/integrase, partial [Acidimicrobiia bacterium]